MATTGGWSLERVDAEALVARWEQAHVDPPIEQTPWWEAVDAEDPDRETAGHYLVLRDGRVLATAILTRLVAHGLPFFWVRHGPVWLTTPDEEAESAALDLFAAEARSLDRRAVTLRIDLRTPLEGTQAPTGLIAYDRTVVLDLSGAVGVEDPARAADAVLATFKARGRRDVRKAVRESGLECADETDRAAADFSEYYAVMADTAGRDGFVPWDAQTYRQMVAGLGPDHCRVYVGRLDGRVVCWSIVTVSGALAARYYAASDSETMRRHVTDRLILFECLDLAARGVRRFDLMGIGSELSPGLRGLNEFKTKFSSEVVEVAAAHELTLRPLVHRAESAVRALVHRMRALPLTASRAGGTRRRA